MQKSRFFLNIAFAASSLLLTGNQAVLACANNDCPTTVEGRMTGGGVFACSGEECSERGLRVTHGFELHCDTSEPNNLEVNWGGNHFHLENLDSATCLDLGNPRPPRAPFNTFIGSGTGRYNGTSGATVTFTLVDNGEPGKDNDTIKITIVDAGGNTVLDCNTTELIGGNHQAHRETGNNN